MKTEAFIHGFYPHSEDLIEINRGVDKGRFSEQELKRSKGLNLLELTALQRDSGFAFVEDGKFGWQDIFRPLIDSTEGLEQGPLTRWLDTNTFFRTYHQPIVNGELKLDERKLGEYLIQMDGIEQKLTLPSPFVFAKLSEDRSASSFGQTYESLSRYLGDVIEFAYSRGIAAVQLNEAFLTKPQFEWRREEVDMLVRSLNAYSKLRNPGQKLFVNFDYDSAGVLRDLEERDLDVDGIGVNFYHTVLTEVPTNVARPLIAGIVEANHSEVDQKTEVASFVEDVAEHTRPQILYLTNSTDLSFVPKNIADQKVRILGELKIV